MNKIEDLSPAQIAYAKELILAMREQWTSTGKICNPVLIAGALGLAFEETGLAMLPETSYRNTPARRIALLWPKKFAGWSAAKIDQLKVNDKAFFDFVYMGINGNGPGDGYKYRGGGPFQTTGYTAYKIMGVKDADALKDIPTACKGGARLLYHLIVQGQNAGTFTAWLGVSSTMQLQDPQKGAYCVWAANTGWSIRPENYPSKRFPICRDAAIIFHNWIVKNGL